MVIIALSFNGTLLTQRKRFFWTFIIYIKNSHNQRQISNFKHQGNPSSKLSYSRFGSPLNLNYIKIYDQLFTL